MEIELCADVFKKLYFPNPNAPRPVITFPSPIAVASQSPLPAMFEVPKETLLAPLVVFNLPIASELLPEAVFDSPKVIEPGLELVFP